MFSRPGPNSPNIKYFKSSVQVKELAKAHLAKVKTGLIRYLFQNVHKIRHGLSKIPILILEVKELSANIA